MKAIPSLLPLLLALSLPGAEPADLAPVPHLERRGAATQLIVDGHPWLIRGGEVNNTASSSLPYMDAVWPRLTQLNLNTVLVGVAWAWVEPAEGKFDFSLVDGLLAGARKNQQRIIFLWFGSWKNSVSSFAPAWVKADEARFPRVRLASGKPVEILSPLNPAGVQADTRAYVKFLQHLRAVDPQHTVLMIQLQNEVGVLGDSRDRSDAANAAFAGPVPEALLDSLRKHRNQLNPELRKVWTDTGSASPPTWSQAFGPGPAADEIFMAWQYATALGGMAAAGKTVLPIPVFTNTWLVQPEDKVPGDYPSGGPEPLVLDIWKAGAPAIDLNCPDVHLPNFEDWAATFDRPDNPIFVPESRGDAGGAANALDAIGAHNSLGYSPFGIDDAAHLLVLRPAPGTPAPADPGSLPLVKAYAMLRDLTPLIVAHQAAGTIRGAWLIKDRPAQDLTLGNYILHVDLRRSSRDQAYLTGLGYGIVLGLGPDEFLVAGTDIQITFTPRTAGPPIAGIAEAETGEVRDGQWMPGRRMSGDDILLNYHLADQARLNQSGSGLRFGPDGPTLQHVRLYRY